MSRLKKRYPKALQRTWDIVEIAKNLVSGRPGLCRPNVFDTADGWRIIVSRENMKTKRLGVLIHFSASIWLKTRTFQDLSDFVSEAIRRFRDLSGWQGEIKFIGFSKAAGIPHFSIPAEKYDAEMASKDQPETLPPKS